MGVILSLALILLTLVGYSSGSVLAGKGKQVIPGLLDLAVVLILLVSALITRITLGKWLAILIWLIVGLAVGFVLTGFRKRKFPDRKQKMAVIAHGSTGLRRWWKSWKAFTSEMGDYQGRMILGYFYFIIVTPFGLSLRVFSDPLGLRRVRDSSFWMERRPTISAIENDSD